jgi:hypothetical protein
MALEQSPLEERPSRGRFSLRSKPNSSTSKPLCKALTRWRESVGEILSPTLPLDGLSSRGLCSNAIEPLLSLWERADRANQELRSLSVRWNKSHRGGELRSSSFFPSLLNVPFSLLFPTGKGAKREQERQCNERIWDKAKQKREKKRATKKMQRNK